SSQEEQKFQYNAKEKLDEFGLYWNDHGARNLDLQTGRWTAIDPLAEKYTPFSPYVVMGNNPVMFLDPDGRELFVKAGVSDRDRAAELQTEYKNVVSNAFNGKVSAAIDTETNKVTFTINEGAELDEYEQKAFNHLNNVALDPEIAVNHTLLDSKSLGSNVILFGQCATGKLDLGDIANVGNNNERMTAKAILVHEAVEQYEKAKLAKQGIDVSSTPKVRISAFKVAQPIALAAENECNAFQRVSDTKGYLVKSGLTENYSIATVPKSNYTARHVYRRK
ncbi:MAG: hypothetical protein EAZ57_11100, partial [Cytophagales bacterium]